MAVPNTTTFDLQDVVDEVNPSSNDLVACFAAANDDYFNPLYEGNKDNLLNFRDYGSHNAASDYTITASPNSYNFSYGLGTTNIYVITLPTAGRWQIKSIFGDFITAYKSDYNKLAVTVSVNTNERGRFGNITLEHLDDSAITTAVVITQEGGIVL